MIANILMLFFRELTTNVITTDVLDYLALELGSSTRCKLMANNKLMKTNVLLDFTQPGSIPKIFKCLQILDDTNYQTLKYLIKHLHT